MSPIKNIYNNEFVDISELRERLQKDKYIEKLSLAIAYGTDKCNRKNLYDKIFGSFEYDIVINKLVSINKKISSSMKCNIFRYKDESHKYLYLKALTYRSPVIKGENYLKIKYDNFIEFSDRLRELLAYDKFDTLYVDMDDGALLEEVEVIFNIVYNSKITTFMFSYINQTMAAKHYCNMEVSRMINRFIQKEDLIIFVLNNNGSSYGTSEFYNILENNYTLRYMWLSHLKLPEYIRKRNLSLLYNQRFKKTKALTNFFD
jgi:hypothetical protein